MAADIENALGESSELIQSSGGVFEIERDGQLVFSKKQLNRFPEEGEVINIAKLLNDGKSLDDAQEESAKKAKKPPTFGQWFNKLMHKQ